MGSGKPGFRGDSSWFLEQTVWEADAIRRLPPLSDKPVKPLVLTMGI